MRSLIDRRGFLVAVFLSWQAAIPGCRLVADDLVMTNGDLLRGRIEKITGSYALVSTAYGVYRLPRVMIRRMHFPVAVPVLVRRMDDSLVEGLLVAVGEETITIRQGDSELSIPWNDVRESFFAGPED